MYLFCYKTYKKTSIILFWKKNQRFKFKHVRLKLYKILTYCNVHNIPQSRSKIKRVFGAYFTSDQSTEPDSTCCSTSDRQIVRKQQCVQS